MITAKLLVAIGIGSKLTIPTYDGSGEIVHIDVYYNGDGWNGYPYWMVMTPYPGGDNQYENPSIVCSLDGNTWVVPEGLTNPLVEAPEGGFNSDTDMIVVGNTMYVLYRKYIAATDTLHYMLMSSTNGVTWTEPVEIYTGLTGDTYGRGIAPSIVFTDNKFKIFSQCASRLGMRWSSSIDSEWSAGESLGYLPLEHNPWHMNVTKHSDGRLFLIGSPKTGELSIIESSDYGATWTGYGSLEISGYRAAMVETPSGFDVWYTNENDVYRTSLIERITTMAGIPPIKNAAYTFYVSVGSQADTDVFQTSVTLAAGDIQVSKDGGAFSNIGTLPTEIGTTGVLPVALTADEMNADIIVVRFHDAAGDEWQDLLVPIETETVQINDLATATALQTVDDNVDAILVDTGTTLDGKLDTIDGIVDSILVDTGTDIPALIAALNDLSAAQVNAEVVDVLRTDTIPDSYSADGAQPTIAQAILAIQQFLYERAVAGTTMTVLKPDGLTTAITLTLDEATSPTKYTRSA